MDIVKKHDRYQIIAEATGEVLDSSIDIKKAHKLLLKSSRNIKFVKLIDIDNYRTIMSVG